MNCPDCDTLLVKAHAELEEGFLTCWICDCSGTELVEGEGVQ